jgi:hypothetical protein
MESNKCCANLPIGSCFLPGADRAKCCLSSPTRTYQCHANLLTVTYTPDSASASTYTTATQSTTVSITSPIGTTVATMTLTPSATSITNLQTVGVTVSVMGGGGQAMPTGTVTLASSPYSASQPLANGTAALNIPAGTLSNGANTLTATLQVTLCTPVRAGRPL